MVAKKGLPTKGEMTQPPAARAGQPGGGEGEAMSIGKIRSALKKAGFKPEKRHTTMVRGYRTIEPGYRLRELKEQNPNWYGFRKMNPPRWMETGIFELGHTDSNQVPTMLGALTSAGLDARLKDGRVVIDTNKARVEIEAEHKVHHPVGCSEASSQGSSDPRP